MLEKLQTFAEKKYQTGLPPDHIVAEYEEKRGDVVEQIEALNITHRMVSTGELVHICYAQTFSSHDTLCRAKS
jgi:amphiphysin